ncbi:MAG: hypothetical protein KatS3mg012_0985 [Gaiellaceae bacterium]|nr:MAG: hypothetical protein KatS3mg012_0985 [Gaiellaceae bacterium]
MRARSDSARSGRNRVRDRANREAEVERVAAAGAQGVLVECEAEAGVLCLERVRASARRRPRDARVQDAVAVAEAKAAGAVVLERVAALVHEPVVVEAEQDEVVEARLAATGPVNAVVGLQVPAALAAGEPAGAVVAGLERAAQGGRDAVASAPDAERDAGALDARQGLRVAAEPARRLRGERWSVGELAAAGAVGLERSGVDVYDEARALAALGG